jgi:hypothetical protein
MKPIASVLIVVALLFLVVLLEGRPALAEPVECDQVSSYVVNHDQAEGWLVCPYPCACVAKMIDWYTTWYYCDAQSPIYCPEGIPCTVKWFRVGADYYECSECGDPGCMDYIVLSPSLFSCRTCG